MKRLGIVGGIAPESTIEYYRLIVAGHRARVEGGGYPPVVINSIDMNVMRGMIEANELGRLADFLLGELRRLERAGADFALLASNTPHLVFDELERRSRAATTSAPSARALRGSARRWSRSRAPSFAPRAGSSSSASARATFCGRWSGESSARSSRSGAGTSRPKASPRCSARTPTSPPRGRRRPRGSSSNGSSTRAKRRPARSGRPSPCRRTEENVRS